MPHCILPNCRGKRFDRVQDFCGMFQVRTVFAIMQYFHAHRYARTCLYRFNLLKRSILIIHPLDGQNGCGDFFNHALNIPRTKIWVQPALVPTVKCIFCIPMILPQFFWQISCFCLLYTSPSPRDLSTSRMPSSA